MDVKGESSRGKYEDYEDDTFYLELERHIVRLIEDDCKTNAASSSVSVTRNEEIRLLRGTDYYDWSVCRNRIGQPPPMSYFPAAGTGVFIPQHNNVKLFEYRDYKK